MPELTTIQIVRVCIALVCLIIASINDLKTRRVPNALTFPMIIFGLLLNVCCSPDRLIVSFVLFVICFVFAVMPGVGMGDVKLLMGMGMFLSATNVMLELALASILVLVVQFIKYPHLTVLTVITRRLRPVSKAEAASKDISNSIPFAPYLLAAAIIIEGATIVAAILNF